MTLLDEVIEAHGGRERWARAAPIRGRVRSGGLLLRTRCPGNRFRDGPARGGGRRAGRLGGAVPARRAARRLRPRRGPDRDRRRRGARVARAPARAASSAGRGLRRNLRWDALDATYFAGYAWWNYLNAPYPARPRRRSRRRDRAVATERGETWRRLEARFPAGLDTHSRAPDASTTTRRCGCAATTTPPRSSAAGRARAHMCADHVEAGGLVFPTRRWVRPIGPGNRPLPAPTLVSSATLRDRGRMNDERHDKPVLWHIPVSHYSEKARWALAYKGVEHERRAPPPGAHIAVAIVAHPRRARRSRSCTLDGRKIGDSTAIIAALEERYADRPSLYPPRPGRAPPGARARGLLRRAARPADPPARLARPDRPTRETVWARSRRRCSPSACATSSALRAALTAYGELVREAALPRRQRRARPPPRAPRCWRRSTGSRRELDGARVPGRRRVHGRRPDRRLALLPARHAA